MHCHIFAVLDGRLDWEDLWPASNSGCLAAVENSLLLRIFSVTLAGVRKDFDYLQKNNLIHATPQRVVFGFFLYVFLFYFYLSFFLLSGLLYFNAV